MPKKRSAVSGRKSVVKRPITRGQNASSRAQLKAYQFNKAQRAKTSKRKRPASGGRKR